MRHPSGGWRSLECPLREPPARNHTENLSGCWTIAYLFTAFALAGAVLSGISNTLGAVAIEPRRTRAAVNSGADSSRDTSTR